MNRVVRPYHVPLTGATRVKLELASNSVLLGVSAASRALNIFVEEPSDVQNRHVRNFAIIRSLEAFDRTDRWEFIGTADFGGTESYHVYEVPTPDPEERQRAELGFP